MAQPIRARMQAEIAAALKARDAQRVSVLRTTLAAVANAEAVDQSAAVAATGDVERRQLSAADIRAIVVRERDELRSDADGLGALGRPEAADLAARAAILDAYLAD